MERRIIRRPVVTARPVECDDDIYGTRTKGGTRRYRPITDEMQVVQQGNKRLVVHHGLPVRRGLDWRIAAGLGATGMVAAIMGVNIITAWWVTAQADQKYGYPRTYQVDAVVGHNDSSQNPSHFIFQNVRGHVLIIEIDGLSANHSHVYAGPRLLGPEADKITITGEFGDETGKGTIDMIVHVGNQRLVYLNDGTQFKEQRS